MKIKKMKYLKTFESYGNDMWVVYANDEKHSAWDGEDEAKHQIEVLEDKGYKNCFYNYEGVEEFVTNGYYYV